MIDKQNDNMLIFSSLQDTDPDFIDLIEKYVTRLPVMLNEIREAAEHRSWNTMRALVHDLNGVSGNYGFPSISKLAVDLTSQLEQQVSDDIKSKEINQRIEQLLKLQSRIAVKKRVN